MHIRRHRKTRIIATLGPSSNTEARIEELFHAGADVFRINMSHGDLPEKADMIAALRRVEGRVGRPIGVMIDLQGPKIRIGRFSTGTIRLEPGDRFILDDDTAPGDQSRVQLPHPEILKILAPGQIVLIDDGRVKLRVSEQKGSAYDCEVVVGGELSDRKGVNIPDVVLPVPALTNRDRSHLDFALEQKADWIALSFVQRSEDVTELRGLVKGRSAVLAKIEKPAALQQLSEIVEQSDALMVARGDLGVEAPVEEVPVLQRRIIRAARALGRPVVVATQMLESMIHSPVPTRAEVSDVATAVFEDADAVMLSAESAIGEFPVQAVEVMDRVAREAEIDPLHRGRERWLDSKATAEDAITGAARQVAQVVNAKAIVCFTTSGSTAIRAARERPDVPIMALTPRLSTARRLSLVWGMHSVKTQDITSFEEMIAKGARMALRHGFAKGGDRIILTAGVPFGTPGATNVLHIGWITGNEIKDYKKRLTASESES